MGGGGAPVAVVDASIVVEALLPGPRRREARRLLAEIAESKAMVAPSGVYEFELLHALRRAWLRKSIRLLREALEAALRVPVKPIHVPRLPLHAASVVEATGCGARDSAYIALAHMLGGVLVTADSGQAAAARRVLGSGRVVLLEA